MAARSRTALLLLDFINTLDFEGGEALQPHAIKAARQAAKLKRRAKEEDVPVIYANDHCGNWRADFEAVVREVERSNRGQELASLLGPEEDDFSILKPRHSAFYGTPLAILLEELKVNRLVLTGLQADICVLFTAHDAYLRKFELWVPRDCVASEREPDCAAALRHMAAVRKADTTRAANGAF